MEVLRLISDRELDDYIESGQNMILLDLRPAGDYRQNHIRTAINIPYDEDRTWDFPRGQLIVVYCERGATSIAVVRELLKKGYRAVSLAGGIFRYRGVNMVS